MTPHLLRSVRARLHLLAFVLVLALPAQAPAATAYSTMYIFGDSLSETGNYAAVGAGELAYPAPYAPGRFSNGPVWVDYLAGALGLPAPTAAAAGGTNYAWGGAMTAGQVGPLPPFDLGMQTLGFLAANNSIADPAALYVVWAGGNDALAGDVTHTAGNLGAVIAALANAGARNFLVPNLPPMGEAFATVNVDLVPVLDSLELAVANAGRADAASLVAGQEATLKLLAKAFEKHQVLALDPVGEPFDPERHEAMVMQPSATAAPDSVLTVVQRGYELNGRLLRPARVIVARAPD